MQYSLSLVHMEVTDQDREQITHKLDRLKKHLLPPYTMDVRYLRSTHHLKGDVITCKVNIEQSGKVFHAEREGSTTLDTLDEVIEALTKELGKAHDKRKDHSVPEEVPAESEDL